MKTKKTKKRPVGRPYKTKAELNAKYDQVWNDLMTIRQTKWSDRTDEQRRKEHYLANYLIRLEKRMDSGRFD